MVEVPVRVIVAIREIRVREVREVREQSTCTGNMVQKVDYGVVQVLSLLCSGIFRRIWSMPSIPRMN